MKVLFVSEFFWPRPAGGEVWAFELCQALAETEDVTVITCKHDGSPAEQEHEGMRILRPVKAGTGRVSRRLATQRLAKAVERHVSQERPDVIHVTAYTMNVPVSRMAKRLGIHCVTAVHAYFGEDWPRISKMGRLLRRLERHAILSDESQLVHVPSRYVQRRIKQDTGKDTLVLHNWLPAKFPRPKRLAPGTYAFVGALEPVKGPLACIPASKGRPLVVIGSGSLERRMRELARKEGVSATFLRRCSREQALAYIGGASLVLVPSVTESFSLVALEAVAQGTPVAGNPVGILPELPGIIPFPPTTAPGRVARTDIQRVRKGFTRERAVQRIREWYRAKV